MMPCRFAMSFILNQGVPILMPIALTSLERAIAQLSLLDNTTTGFPSSFGLKARSHDTKKLLQSINAIGMVFGLNEFLDR